MAAGRPESRHSPTTACSRLQWTLAERLFADAILLQPAIEGAAAHAELFGGEADVAVVARQHFLDEDTLRFLERQIVGRRRLAGNALPQAEMPDGDEGRIRIRHQYGALH